jgi:hypothetical protein
MTLDFLEVVATSQLSFGALSQYRHKLINVEKYQWRNQSGISTRCVLLLLGQKTGGKA